MIPAVFVVNLETAPLQEAEKDKVRRTHELKEQIIGRKKGREKGDDKVKQKMGKKRGGCILFIMK